MSTWTRDNPDPKAPHWDEPRHVSAERTPRAPSLERFRYLAAGLADLVQGQRASDHETPSMRQWVRLARITRDLANACADLAAAERRIP